MVPPGLLSSGLRLPVLRPQMLIHRSSYVLLPLPVQAGPRRRVVAVLLFCRDFIDTVWCCGSYGSRPHHYKTNQARPVLTRRTPSVIIFLYCFAGLKYKTRPSQCCQEGRRCVFICCCCAGWATAKGRGPTCQCQCQSRGVLHFKFYQHNQHDHLPVVS